MKSATKPLCVMAGLNLLLPLILLMKEAVGSSERLNEKPGWLDAASSDQDPWPGEDPSSYRRGGYVMLELDDDLFDNSDPYIMDGSDDIPVHRPFVPFDPLTKPGIIRRPVAFDRNLPKPDTTDDETSWRWPSDTVKPEQTHTTLPTTSVTHAQMFRRPEEAPSIRLHGEVVPASHHAESSNQPGEVNYLNKQIGESSEYHVQNEHQQPQSHESTQVQVVESGGMQPAQPSSEEEVYGISGELSTLDHVAKTTPMQNGIVKEGGSGGDSVEQPTTTVLTVKRTTTGSIATAPATGNIHTSVLSSVGLIIQQSAVHSTTTTTAAHVNKTPSTKGFSGVTTPEEKHMPTVRPPIYRSSSGLSEVTRYSPGRVSTGTVHAIDSKFGRLTEDTDLPTHGNENANTQAMTVVTRKSIKVSTSDDTPTSHEITDGLEETGTTSGILGVRVKFTMSGEDERFTSTDDSAETDITDDMPTDHTMPSTVNTTTISSTEHPTTHVHDFTTTPTTSTVTNIVATNRLTKFNPITNTLTNVNSTSKVTNSNATTHTVSELVVKSTTTSADMTPTTTAMSDSSTTNVVTKPLLTTNSGTNMNVSYRVTPSRATTSRHGKAIGISVGNRLITSRLPRQNTTHFGFSVPTTEITPMADNDIPTTTPTSLPTVVTNKKEELRNMHPVIDSSSENGVFTATTQQDTVQQSQDSKVHNSTNQHNLTTISTNTATKKIENTTTSELSITTLITNAIMASSKVTQNPVYIHKASNNTTTHPSTTSHTTLPMLKPESATTPTTAETNSTTLTSTTTKRTKISTYANKPFVLPTAPSVLDDPKIREKFTSHAASSEQMDPSELDNFSIPTAPSVITNPTVERATIRRRLRPLLMRTTPGSVRRPTLRSRTNTITHPAVTPYPTRSTTSPQPDLQETMAPPVIHLDDNHIDNRQLEPPDIHKFFEDKEAEETVFITPATTNTIIISSVIGGCAILFFFIMMIFCMCKQKKLRRARYRQPPPPPDYANVFVGKYS